MPKYEIAFSPAEYEQIVRDAAARKGLTVNDFTGHALKEYVQREEDSKTGAIPKNPTDPECEIGFRTNERP